MQTGTFSILAFSEDYKLLGVAVASGSMGVGLRVPYAKPGVGVIATQAYTNINYGIKGLKLLEKGLRPQEILRKLLAEDMEREKRQVAIIDLPGEKAVFTGVEVPIWRGQIVGKNYIVIGNFLKGEEVLESIAEEFEKSQGHLAIRLVNALKSGSESGGDRRGERSASLTIVSSKKVEISLRIDEHKDPTKQLFEELKNAL
ncbi:MAG: DUF1028 domain-containing protein [Candidatus Bathyarchaeia archaeon]